MSLYNLSPSGSLTIPTLSLQPSDDIFLYLYFCKHYTQYQGIISIVKYNFVSKI